MKQLPHRFAQSSSKTPIWVVLFFVIVSLSVLNLTAAQHSAAQGNEGDTILTPTAGQTIPTPTPGGTTPGTIPPDSSMVIRPGIITEWDYTNDEGVKTEMVFPPEAVEEETTFFYTELALPSVEPRGFRFAGRSFILEAYKNGIKQEDYRFQEPIFIEIEYRDQDVEELNEGQLRLYAYDPEAQRWSPEGITTDRHDMENNRLRARVEHLTEFALGEAEHLVWLPFADR